MSYNAFKFSLEKKKDGFDINKKSRFTGEYTDKEKELFKAINEAIEKRNCVTCDAEFEEEGDKKRYEGLAASHAYTVLGTKVEKINGKDIIFVRIRNPWGSLHTGYRLGGMSGSSLITDNLKDAATDGINEVELDDFYNRMQEVTITEGPIKK